MLRFFKTVGCSTLALAAGSLLASPAYAIEVPGVGHEGQGADLVLLQLDGNSRPDMILVAYDNPPGANSFRYKVGLNLDAAGNASSWSGHIQVAGLGHEGQGAGAAVADFDGNGRPELVLMAYDNPSGANNFRYTIGWNLNAQGVATNWTNHAQVAGVGDLGQGAAVVIGQVDGNPRPDMIFIAYDNPSGANTFRYRVGFNVNTQGNATWSASHVQVPGVGNEGEGLGAALANVDGDARPDLMLLAYDAPAGANSFRLRTGLNLNAAGVAASWQPGFQTFAGVGHLGQGAGLAIACLDGDPRADWITLAYDNPSGANSFRYTVHPNRSQAPCPTLVGSGAPGPAPVSQRKSITELSATELASLRRAYAQMRAWNSAPRNSADFRRSLQYWANMHSFFGQNCRPTTGLSQPGMQGVTQQAMSNQDEIDTWCKCEHGTEQFLTWHRMYLFYFEQVLQAASGDPNLRLPYWDYERNGQLPQAYRDLTWAVGGVNQPNPLRVDNRQSGLNAGTASLGTNTTSTANAMAQSSYGTFNSLIEGTPHGAVHCAVAVANCPTGIMGAVPAAGLDPIFYSHHANIDRLYECWVRVSPTRLPSGTMLDREYFFIDGSGNKVSRRVRDMLTTAQLGYGYTPGAGCPAGIESGQVAGGATPAAAEPQRFELLGPVRLERGVTRAPVRVDPSIRQRLTAETSGNPRSLLIIEDVEFDVAPGVHYNVYFEGPGGRRILVGVVNFFGRDHHGEHEGSDRIVLDATEALVAFGGANARPTIVIEPDTGIEEDSTAEAVRRINPRANVRFGRMRIEVVE